MGRRVAEKPKTSCWFSLSSLMCQKTVAAFLGLPGRVFLGLLVVRREGSVAWPKGWTNGAFLGGLHQQAAIKACHTRAPLVGEAPCAEMPMRGKDNIRTAAEILVDQLRIHGVRHVFCVPGESYLAVLDAFHDSDLAVTVCRQEGGAAMMAEAVGKATGRPGVCFVTRGPGATNASPGIHIARQDSTPLVMFVGQVARDMREREAFQEIDYRAMFGSMTKWATEIDDPARIPEIVSRAFYTPRTAGRGRSSSACPRTC